MNKRELYKVVEISGRKWRIGKFDAMTGSYIAYKLMSEILPLGIAEKIGISAPAGSPSMGKKDFIELQRDCLSVCAELLDAGPTPVLNDNGNWGVIDIEFDAKTVLALTIQALAWNISSFFDESLLNSLSEAMQSLSLPTVKT